MTRLFYHGLVDVFFGKNWAFIVIYGRRILFLSVKHVYNCWKIILLNWVYLFIRMKTSSFFCIYLVNYHFSNTFLIKIVAVNTNEVNHECVLCVNQDNWTLVFNHTCIDTNVYDCSDWVHNQNDVQNFVLWFVDWKTVKDVHNTWDTFHCSC